MKASYPLSLLPPSTRMYIVFSLFFPIFDESKQTVTCPHLEVSVSETRTLQKCYVS